MLAASSVPGPTASMEIDGNCPFIDVLPMKNGEKVKNAGLAMKNVENSWFTYEIFIDVPNSHWMVD